MTPISTDAVENAAEWLFDTAQEAELDALLDEFAETQPFLLTYLMSMGEEDFNEEEQEILLFLGIGIWKMMSPGLNSAEPVSETLLDAVRAQNEPLLESLSPEADSDFSDEIEALLPEYSQAAILAFILEEVDQDPDIRETNKGSMAAFLKILVDVMDHEE